MKAGLPSGVGGSVGSTPYRPITTRPAALQRPAWLSPTVWPFDSCTIDSDGSKIAVTDVGGGPVLLFVHTGFWSFIWRDVILRLSAEFRCVCFDAPGTGQSECPRSSEISLGRAGRALTSVVQVLDLQNITLVFHDLGGPSGVAGAAQMPERFCGLCAVNTFAWRPSGAPFRFMLSLMGSRAMREFDALTGIMPRIAASPFGIGRRMDQPSREAFLAGIGTQGIRSFHNYLRDAGRGADIYPYLDTALIGPFRRLPLLSIFGERNDPFGFQPRWKTLFRNARQVVVSRGNHFPMCDDPDLVSLSICTWHRECVRPWLAEGRP